MYSYPPPAQPAYGAGYAPAPYPGPSVPAPYPYGQPPAAPPSAYGGFAPPPAAGAPPAAPPAGGQAYPSLAAPVPSHAATSTAEQAQSAYPAMGGLTSSAFGLTPDAPTSEPRPATAPSAPPQPAPAPGPAPYTYGQPHAAPQHPPGPLAYGQPPNGQPPPGPGYGYNPPPPTPPSHPPAMPPGPAYMPPTTYAPAPGHGARRRRALLIGCSYPGSSAQLNGCINDVQCIQFCLKKRFGFTDQQILVLRDDQRHPDFISTKANIYRGIQWLMADQQPGDSLFFHFSGHGSQQYDRNGDEEDGYDETICPTDFRHAGQIVDDELNALMVRPLLPGVTLHAVIDACHSGTALDLPYRAKVDGAGRWYWKGRHMPNKATRGGTAFQFGACKDSQVAQDTNALSGKAYTGAATFCFIEAIEKYGTQQTYGQILSHMMATLRATTKTNGIQLGSTGTLIASFLLGSNVAAAISAGGGQTPVLSCDKPVDLYNTRLNL